MRAVLFLLISLLLLVNSYKDNCDCVERSNHACSVGYRGHSLEGCNCYIQKSANKKKYKTVKTAFLAYDSFGKSMCNYCGKARGEGDGKMIIGTKKCYSTRSVYSLEGCKRKCKSMSSKFYKGTWNSNYCGSCLGNKCSCCGYVDPCNA